MTVINCIFKQYYRHLIQLRADFDLAALLSTLAHCLQIIGTSSATRSVHSSAKDCTMLILTRRHGENLMIGDDVTVTVLGMKGGQVRFGITAPRETPVHREEVAERIAAVKQAGVTP